MRTLLAVPFAGLALFAGLAVAGCKLGANLPDAMGSKAGDAAKAQDAPGEDVAAEVSGCDWAASDWTFTDCSQASFALRIVVLGGAPNCQVQVVSDSSVFLGAWGQVHDAALALVLPGLGGATCQGSFDGQVLRGACTTAQGPCTFVAAKGEVP